jgi:hypothetical protein
MTYQAEPENANKPADSDGAGYAAEELRALKQLLQTYKTAWENTDAALANVDVLLADADTAEATARSNADSAEATARENADTALANSVSAEATTRETNDDALQTAINDLIRDTIYRVGNYYITDDDDFDPNASLSFGNWAKLPAGTSLVGRDPLPDNEFSVTGTEGGSPNKTMSVAEMPEHNHTITDPGHTHDYTDRYSSQPTAIGRTNREAADDVWNDEEKVTDSSTTGITLADTGSGNQFSLMNPYRVTNIWLRIS